MIEFVEAVRHPNGLPDLTCPVLVCDTCREVVYRNGNVEWRWDPAGRKSPLYTSHKGKCSRTLKVSLDRRYPGWLMQWRPADEFLAQLVNNFHQPVHLIEGVSEVRIEESARQG